MFSRLKDDDGLSLSCAYDPPLTKQCSVVEGEMQLVELELQWRQSPPCSSWDTGRVAQLMFSPSVESLN